MKANEEKFYMKYWKEYFVNVNLVKQLLSAVTDHQRLEDALKDIADTTDSTSGKRKRHRRPAHEIRRHYRCPATECQKAYGSEGSLSQHLKLKHRNYFEQYSKVASAKAQSLMRQEELEMNEAKNALSGGNLDDKVNNIE